MAQITHTSFRLAPLLCAGLGLLIAGCSTTPSQQTPSQAGTQIEQDQSVQLIALAQDATAKGNYIIAAQYYLQLAEHSDSPTKDGHYLAAAEAFARGKQPEQTQQVIAEIDSRQLSNQQRLRLRMVQARIALQASDTEQALEQMRYPTDQSLPWELLAQWHALKADIFTQAENYIAATRERVILENMLGDDLDRQRNHQQIWESLAQLTAPALVTLRDQPPPDIFSGWVELAYFAKISENNPSQFEKQIQQWQERYPSHPAQGEFIEALTSTQKMLFFRPEKIAVLLPLSGSFSTPANAIRDGFLGAYYAREDKTYTPHIKVYDTTDDVDAGLFTYQRAVAEGADIIIGPLHKPMLEALAKEEEIPVTTLALNYLPSADIRVNNLYQYGLLPEDEARQVAERAWLDGHNNALALIPEGEWGDRMLATFEKNWRQLDGHLLEVQRYNPSKHDFAGPVIDLLNIDNSKQRHRDLEATLGINIKTEARRRQDVDFIFVAAFPQQARQIRPQLKFYYASDVPIYSTSHAFSGETNATLDRDMDGITFCDMPWILDANAGPKPHWQDITHIWKGDAIPLKRLYAMGVDAYRLIGLIPKLENSQDYVSAQTGSLYLDGVNRIHRQLLWANFHRGIPRLIEPAANDPS